MCRCLLRAARRMPPIAMRFAVVHRATTVLCVTKIDKSNTFIRHVLMCAACDVCHVQPTINRHHHMPYPPRADVCRVRRLPCATRYKSDNIVLSVDSRLHFSAVRTLSHFLRQTIYAAKA